MFLVLKISPSLLGKTNSIPKIKYQKTPGYQERYKNSYEKTLERILIVIKSYFLTQKSIIQTWTIGICKFCISCSVLVDSRWFVDNDVSAIIEIVLDVAVHRRPRLRGIVFRFDLRTIFIIIRKNQKPLSMKLNFNASLPYSEIIKSLMISTSTSLISIMKSDSLN